LRPALKNLQNIKRLKGIEIGVGDGFHAEIILKNLDIHLLYLIDPYIHYEGYKGRSAKREHIAREKLKRWNEKLIWVKEFSDRASLIIKDRFFDFVYVDGNHQEKYVIEDIKNYYNKVKNGGLICGHDYNHKQVKKAVSEIFNTADINVEEKDWWVWKDDERRNNINLHNENNEI
jgi:hypothetical protein